MALIKCRNCGAEISDRAPDCIHCGALIIKETAAQQELARLEQEKLDLEAENAKYKAAVTTAESHLASEQTEKARLVTEKEALSQHNQDLQTQQARLEAKNDSLQQRNLELEKQLKDSVKKTKALEEEKIRAKKAKEVKRKSQKTALKVGAFLRLLLAGFFAFAAMVSLFSGKFGLTLWYGALAVTIAPYIYHFLWTKVEISKTLKIAIEVLVPVVILFL